MIEAAVADFHVKFERQRIVEVAETMLAFKCLPSKSLEYYYRFWFYPYDIKSFDVVRDVLDARTNNTYISIYKTEKKRCIESLPVNTTPYSH